MTDVLRARQVVFFPRMSDANEQLVHDVIALTGADTPVLYEQDTPVLSTDVTSDSDVNAFYFVGLIGGKDVGKTSLVNALAGVKLGTESNHGAGTSIATAYCHSAGRDAVFQLLRDRAGEGQFQIVTHDNDALRHQVLLDLPDIDSHFTTHLDLTRRMLRQMLFPVWVQSVEKYADLRPQQLLAKVSTGNDPQNFLFVMSKIDQVVAREGDDAALELRDDFAKRIARTLALNAPPRVYMTATPLSDRFDLPELKRHLSREKSTERVVGARQLASARRDRSLLAWLDAQHLPERVKRLETTESEALELLTERVVAPLVETALPRMAEDPVGRAALVDQVTALRVSRWPLVPLVHTLLWPVLTVVRANSSASVISPTSPDALVDAYLSIDGQPVARATQAAFALLRQSHPAVSELYTRVKLWDTHASDVAAQQLRADLARAVQHQRDRVRERVAGKSGVFAPVLRVVLTVGVALWFPIVQPVLELAVSGVTWPAMTDLLGYVVPVLGADHLLRSAAMLIVWFVALYLWLRRDTQRRVDRMLRRSATVDTDPASLHNVVSEWANDLVEPIRMQRDRIANLVERRDRIARRDEAPRATVK